MGGEYNPMGSIGIKYTKTKILYCYSENVATYYGLDRCVLTELTIPHEIDETISARKVVLNLGYGSGKINIKKLQNAETIYADVGNGWEYIKDRVSGKTGLVDLTNDDERQDLEWALLQA